MKNYFNFTLTGNKLLPVWLFLFFLVFVPMIFLQIRMEEIDKTAAETAGDVLPYTLGILLLYLAMYAIYFFFIKLSIEGVTYKEKAFAFLGTFGKYLGVLIVNLLLTIITLGIYLPWLITKIYKFFVENTEYESQRLNFKSKGGELFVIILLSLFLPLILVMVIIGGISGYQAIAGGAPNPNMVGVTSIIMMALIFVIIIPYYYFFYRWMINVQFKEYHIHWETEFWPSAGKIAVELLLTIITVGIYFPAAMVKLYDYFVGHTVAESGADKKRFGYELETTADFGFIWIPMLLTIVTLGIYYPWAFCKINKRILSKTYVESSEEELVVVPEQPVIELSQAQPLI